MCNAMSGGSTQASTPNIFSCYSVRTVKFIYNVCRQAILGGSTQASTPDVFISGFLCAAVSSFSSLNHLFDGLGGQPARCFCFRVVFIPTSRRLIEVFCYRARLLLNWMTFEVFRKLNWIFHFSFAPRLFTPNCECDQYRGYHHCRHARTCNCQNLRLRIV